MHLRAIIRMVLSVKVLKESVQFSFNKQQQMKKIPIFPRFAAYFQLLIWSNWKTVHVIVLFQFTKYQSKLQLYSASHYKYFNIYVIISAISTFIMYVVYKGFSPVSFLNFIDLNYFFLRSERQFMIQVVYEMINVKVKNGALTINNVSTAHVVGLS